MHKLLTGKLCDARWTWTCKVEDALHMALLMGAHHVHHGVLQPFLMIHLCFCVHEYRRMGFTASNKCHVPAFDSPLRTVIIDLAALRDAIDPLKSVDWGKLLDAVKKCKDTTEAVGLLGEFKVGRLKVVSETLPNLTTLKPSCKDVLDDFCPKLYYPSTTPVDKPRRFFLTFDEFLDRVTDIARQH